VVVSYYERIGVGYAERRRPDARIRRHIDEALGDARTVVNVGAGAGSYEPADRDVVAVEPTWTMLQQRPRDAGPAVRARAEALPFPDRSFDAALAVLTIHHWTNLDAGLAELRRVAPRQVILSFDISRQRELWLVRDYIPACADLEEARARTMEQTLASLDAPRVTPVPVPADCIDGFCGAYWRRPEAYLDPGVRQSISSLAQLPPEDLEPGLALLAEDLASGRWHERNADLLDRDELDLGYCLIVAGDSGDAPA
jgi:SAM-dependent methyltransferase